jgi:MIP family channel proteins
MSRHGVCFLNAMLTRFERSVYTEDRPAEKGKDGSLRDSGFGLAQRLAAEIIGTFLLVFVDAGGAMVAAISGGEQGSPVTAVARSLAAGLTVMAMIYSISEISGAHINPAVTFGFALRGSFPWRRVPAYWLAELSGALLAALCLRGLIGDVEHVGMTMPHHGAGLAVAFEIVLSFTLMTVILGTAAHEAKIGKEAAIAVGGTVALCGLFSRPISGASMNPARSLGPAIVGGAWNVAWIYVVGPLAGMALAVAACRLLHGPRRDGEKRAAQGAK